MVGNEPSGKGDRNGGNDGKPVKEAASGQFLTQHNGRLTQERANSKRFTVVEARAQFAEMINQTSYGKERIILTRQGKDLAALISVEDLNLFEQLLEEAEERLEVEEAENRLSDPAQVPIPYERVRKRLNIE
jgi:prevent-host-death family protein